MKDFKNIWKDKAKSKNLTKEDFISRAVLIAMASKSNMDKSDIIHILLHRYFSPITNSTKLNNGMVNYDGLNRAMRFYRWLNPKPPFAEKQWPNFTILGVPADQIFDTIEEFEDYLSYHKSIVVDRIDREYIYYFTRQDISAEQQGVQAGHVLFKLGTQLSGMVNPDNIYFQWIGVEDHGELYQISKKYKEMLPIAFYEPDMGNTMTSVALPPVLWYKRGDLINYKLLSHAH